MVPELARLLSDYAKQDTEVDLNKLKALLPHWYAAFAEGVFGSEHNLNYPMDSFQIFTVQAWIENDTGENLARYADIPWLEAGDIFYVQKLAEAVKAYRGVTWV